MDKLDKHPVWFGILFTVHALLGLGIITLPCFMFYRLMKGDIHGAFGADIVTPSPFLK